MKNDLQFIQQQLTTKLSFRDHLNGLKLGLIIEFRTLLSGRKWFIYYMLGIFPLFIALIGNDHLLGDDDAAFAFVDIFMASTYMVMFTFGCLLISLPISSDEITDNTMPLYLIKPISRSVIWITRWIVSVVGVVTITTLINISFYLYFHLLNPDGIFAHFYVDLYLLWNSFIFTVYAGVLYVGIFLLVGFIGERAFTWGMLLALFETFLLSLLFLQDNITIPRTHLSNIGDSLFGSYYVYETKPANLSLTNSYMYIGLVSLILFVLGILVVKRKEFKSA